MFADSRKVAADSVVETDLCIAGAGVAGITLARELASAGFKTTIIESGGLKPDKVTQSLYWGKNIGIPYYPLDTSRARFFGGTSHFWHIKLPQEGMGVRLRPLDPIDFERRDWIPYSGWPFKKSDLDPYYERAQTVCQIGPYNYDANDWAEDGRTPFPFSRNNDAQSTIFQFAERELFFKTYRRQIEQSQDISVLLHGNVTEIYTDENLRNTQWLRVQCIDGPGFRVKAKFFVLALGGIETARLMLLSRSACPNGVGNQNDVVGRFFMEHPHLWSGVYLPASLQVSNSTGLYQLFRKNGVPAMAKLTLSDKTLRNEKLANWCASIHPDFRLSYQQYMQYDKKGVAALRSLRRQPISSRSLSRIADVITDPQSIALAAKRKLKGAFKSEFSRQHHPAVFQLNHMSEQTPNPDSRVLLSDETDALGQQRVNLDWRLNAIDVHTITRAQEILDGELRRAGLGGLKIESRKDEIPPKIHGGWHHMGTTRMHPDPKQGVVDADCRVHGMSNLFIAGASTFPTVGYANPVLTTIAVVLRLADHLKQLID